MALKLQFSFTEGKKLDAIVMDATLSEAHSYSADVTDFPVERGSAITDNVREKPTQLRIDAFISDFPLQNPNTQQSTPTSFTQSPLNQTKRSQDALDTLNRLKREGVTITVTTGIRTYKNMVIQTIDVTRDKSIRNGIRFTMSLREIIVVQTQTVQVVAAEPKGQNKQADGPKSASDASDADSQKGSFTAKIFDSAGGGKVLPK